MSVWRFSIVHNKVYYGEKQRTKLTKRGCNEPFKDRYWCPKQQWFRRAPCPFINQRECENYIKMCGCL
ncbi:MAG: hypothetical protein KKB30_06860 [Proteobacteria bacterium]|nr:hypothetical protein [Pseudomonadota bacterium]MBU1715437.1 hypothetical protein [Pseudomonadota bacterium]